MIVLGLAANVAWGETPTIVRVEEDWELAVAVPDLDSQSPQVSCVISPSDNVTGLYAAFELNHRTLPEYSAGGMQVQLWYGEEPLWQCDAPSDALLNTQGEKITWTQAVQVADGVLTFEILNGQSTTWGAFGGQGYLRAVFPATVSSLNAYRPEVSVKHSGAGYAANRVQSLVLKRVRYFTADGQQLVDTTERVVHSQP